MTNERQKGLSLIEILVAITLSSLIIAGIIQVFLSNRQAYSMNESMVRIQESGRFAIDYMSDAIRQSGSYGCVPFYSAEENNIQSFTADIPSDEFGDINPSTTDGAAIAGAFDAPDSIKVIQTLSNAAFINSIVEAPSLVINLGAGGDFENGSVLLVSNCEVGDYITAGADTAGNAIANFSPGLRKDFYNRLNMRASVSEVRFLEFAVTQDANGINVLTVSVNGAAAQELVQGIENIQFKYGIDTDGDFVPDYFDDFPDIDLLQMGNGSALVAVHISVLAVSDRDNVIAEPQNNIVFNDQTLNATDRRLRRVFESTVTFRNRVN